MKSCPKCKREYNDGSLNFCLEDGEWLVEESGAHEDLTAIFTPEILEENVPTRTFGGSPTSHDLTQSSAITGPEQRRTKWLAVGGVVMLLFAVAAFGAYWLYPKTSRGPIRSIAVMPFSNESGTADVEYLSDGISESLINNLSKIPNLSVKARSTVFRYKGKTVDPASVGKEMAVQAVLNGRVVQRGDDVAVYLSLVDTNSGDQIWGEDYQRKLSELVSLQKEITSDVSGKLQLRLTEPAAQKVTNGMTENAEAYQLYLRGRHHLVKSTPPEIDKSISYFQQAIAIDPLYTMAYVGLADAYRAPGAERFPADALSKSKAAAQKAIQLDDSLADAHAVLGFIIFWYEWNWAESEKELRRAIDLDPRNADAHLFYAHLLSNLGRHPEALAEAQRARELDPLNVRTNALEGQYLLHAGQIDAGMARLAATKELDPDNWMAHLFSTSGYIEKGMYREAIAEGRKTNEIQPHSRSFSFLGYALAKSGDRVSALRELEKLLAESRDRWVSPYSIALVYLGLEDRDEAIAWLERGLSQRDPRMVFLKVEPKWNAIRSDPRFQKIFNAVGLPK
ncbi:MAG: tetratricopeptide repeat protein [Pyrinomonadaceae bacterium]